MYKSKPRSTDINEMFTDLNAYIASGDMRYVEYEKDGMYFGRVPEIPHCHAQAKNPNELHVRMNRIFSSYVDFIYSEIKKSRICESIINPCQTA